MLSLSIFCSSQTISLAIYNEKKLIFLKKKKILDNKIEGIFKILKECTNEFELKKISQIYFSTGPGSFTALRSIKVISQALALSSNSVLRTTSSFSPLIASIQNKDKKVLACFKSTNNKFFYQIFEKIVTAHKNNKNAYAQAYANELAQVRKMKNMVSGAKLSMEQVKLRLDTVSELGDVVVTLSPCMSIIKGLAPSLNGIMPEANASMQDLSSILGDVMSGSSVELGDSMSVGPETNADTLAILEEAQGVIAGQAKASIPDVPESLKQQIVERKSDVFI